MNWQEEALTTDAASAYIGGVLKASTLSKLRSVGGGPRFLRVGSGRGGRVLYLKRDLDDYILSRRMRSTAELRSHA